MTEWLPLPALATRARSGAGAAAHARFRTAVQAWRVAFEGSGARAVALHCDDVSTFAAALFGAWHAGVTVWLPGDVLPQTRAVLRDRVDAFAGDAAGDLAPAFDTAVDAASLDDWRALHPVTTRLVVFTSGSSGEATAIAKTLRQLAAEVDALEATFGSIVGASRVHATVSHQHIYGLLFRVLWPLASGREIATRRVLFHEDMHAALLQSPGVLVSSPAHLKRLPDGLDWTRLQGHVIAVFSSGGALPDDAARDALAKLGTAPLEIYGSSETGGIAWRRSAGDGRWSPLPGVEWRSGDDGRLQVRSPHLPDDDWFTTEDRAAADADGLRLLGRADRIVKLEERRVSLTALERALVDTGLVREARVVLLDGPRSVLAAACVPTEAGASRLHAQGKATFARVLRAALAAGHDPVAMPRRWRFPQALPQNAQGKVLERGVLDLFRPQMPTVVWQRREATHATLVFDTTADLLVFDGHFPQAPVLPGVAQVDWAVRFAREAFALPPSLSRMEALKFQRIVGVGVQVTMTLDWSPERGVLTFALRSDAGPHASGRLVFSDAAVTP